MKKFTDLKKIDIENTILEIIKELNRRSSVEMGETDVANILDIEGKKQAAFFTLNSPIKVSLENSDFSCFLSDLSMKDAKGVVVGILGSQTLKLSELRDIISSIQMVANQSALITFSSSTESDVEAGCLLFVLTTGVE